jgi:hypothetical protein
MSISSAAREKREWEGAVFEVGRGGVEGRHSSSSVAQGLKELEELGQISRAVE